MARMKRIKIRVSLPVEEALLLKSEQQEKPLAAVAADALRVALQRTIDSAECQARITTRRAQSTRDDWAFDREEAIQLEIPADELSA